MAYYDSYDPGTGAYPGEPSPIDAGGSIPGEPGTNWWQGPPPAGYTGPWPPPLPPGASYGPLFGQIVYGSDPSQAGTPGATPIDLNDPSTYYHPGDWTTRTPTDPSPPPPAPPPPAPPPPGTSNPGTIGGILAPFTGTFTPPADRAGLPSWLPQTPVFTPPTYAPPPAFSYESFQAPTAEEALTDPGYQFARNEGQAAIERSKAAAGTLNTGGTLKDILAWGQNYATQRYGDVFHRKHDVYDTNRANAVDVYNRNYQTQYADPYQIAYRGALDAFSPQMTAYTTQAQAGQRANELDYRNSWDRFQFDYDKWRDQRDSTFNKTFQYVTA